MIDRENEKKVWEKRTCLEDREEKGIDRETHRGDKDDRLVGLLVGLIVFYGFLDVHYPAHVWEMQQKLSFLFISTIPYIYKEQNNSLG